MDNQYFYVYAFSEARSDEKNELEEVQGIEEGTFVEMLTFGDLAAVVCRVPAEDYEEETLKSQLENINWLQTRAFHHHELMNYLHSRMTIVPLKFGTIYKNTESLKKAINAKQDTLSKALGFLKDKEEWNVKIFVDQAQFFEQEDDLKREIKEKREEIDHLSKGKRFFAQKKLDQYIEGMIQEKIDLYCESLHEKLKVKSARLEVKKNWNQQVTGRDETMAWNSVYLIEADQYREEFQQEIKDFQSDMNDKEIGLIVECTGPWPAYHFADVTSDPVEGVD
ncbi:GvpL/GvpF family gas vesicle protein [Halalkalibacillus sediminis]|uniref:GvpL/GvpF family gas vesicle protein n=1 Tax=Halalkalibacillus sediminis TaxID=2018042 RepID=UPI0013902B39|nr:GvpL/GvpF family gas vesicle protein [Halalkalibacillus sediminis]